MSAVIDDAKQRLVGRIRAVVDGGAATISRDAAALLFAGTDVSASEALELMSEETHRVLLAMMEAPEESALRIMGALTQALLLGWELGRHAQDV